MTESDESGRTVVPTSAWFIDGGRVRVAAASPEELAIVAGILDEASAWLEARGYPQWPRPFPVESLEADAANRIVYLAWDGSTAVGTLALHKVDRTFWGDLPAEPPGHAMYLHKLAVRRGNRGLGRALVELAAVIARSSGAECLRLDCVADNSTIRSYYEGLGFEHRGDLDVPDLTWRASLYERSLV
ncbi:MAG: GNAT family N-acetyltransferase [Candidatus Limnocylindrales bacterium]